jgi:hypothetical protein
VSFIEGSDCGQTSLLPPCIDDYVAPEAFDRNGHHDFDALWDREQDEAVQLCAFDLLELDGDDLREKPLLDRKRRSSSNTSKATAR